MQLWPESPPGFIRVSDPTPVTSPPQVPGQVPGGLLWERLNVSTAEAKKIFCLGKCLTLKSQREGPTSAAMAPSPEQAPQSLYPPSRPWASRDAEQPWEGAAVLQPILQVRSWRTSVGLPWACRGHLQ